MDSNLKNTILDSVTDLLYYDRKEDESLPLGAIEEMIRSGKVTADEIVEVYSAELKKQLELET